MLILITLFISQSLLLTHDTISQKDYTPKLPELPFDIVDEEEETVKIVQLVKSNEPMVKQRSSFPFDSNISKPTHFSHASRKAQTAEPIVVS